MIGFHASKNRTGSKAEPVAKKEPAKIVHPAIEEMRMKIAQMTVFMASRRFANLPKKERMRTVIDYNQMVSWEATLHEATVVEESDPVGQTGPVINQITPDVQATVSEE